MRFTLIRLAHHWDLEEELRRLPGIVPSAVLIEEGADERVHYAFVGLGVELAWLEIRAETPSGRSSRCFIIAHDPAWEGSGNEFQGTIRLRCRRRPGDVLRVRNVEVSDSGSPLSFISRVEVRMRPRPGSSCACRTLDQDTGRSSWEILLLLAILISTLRKLVSSRRSSSSASELPSMRSGLRRLHPKADR